MKRLSVYLSGPMSGMTVETSSSWRQEVARRLSPFVEVIDPSREYSFLGVQDKKDIDPASLVGTHTITKDESIVIRDRFDVRRSDIVLANFIDGPGTVSIGSVAEVSWAIDQDKPVILAAHDGDIHLHPMMTARSIRAYSLDEAIQTTLLLLNR